MNRNIKPAKNSKPRSKAQRINSQAQWLINFRLQKIRVCDVNEMPLSIHARTAISRLNGNIDTLKRMIAYEARLAIKDAKIDARLQKELDLSESKKDVDTSP